MRAKDMMESPVLTVDAGLDALSCARRMAEARRGYAILLRDGRMAGIVTEWDFLDKVVAAGKDASQVPVESIATTKVHSCRPEVDADEVIEEMAREGVRRMIVISGDQVVGIITARAVLAHFRQYVDRLSADIAAHQSDPVHLV